jgi:hypothetical protein
VTPGDVLSVELTYDVDERGVSAFVHIAGPNLLILDAWSGDDSMPDVGIGFTHPPVTSPWTQAGVNGGAASVTITYTTP